MAAHTPDLVTELAGIAEGAGVAADELLAYNLLDEEWWYSETLRSKCSALAVPARDGRPGAGGARRWTCRGRWTAARCCCATAIPDGREVAVLSSAGFLGLTGCNSATASASA